MTRVMMALMAMAVALMMGPSAAWAQNGYEAEEAEESTEAVEFEEGAEAAQGAEEGTASTRRSLPESERRTPGGNLVLITYMVLWVMVGALVLVMWRRQQALQEEIDELEGRLDQWLDES